MSKYAIAKEAIDSAISTAAKSGWTDRDVLQALVTTAIGYYQQDAGAADTRAMLEYELANVSDRLDLDFIRSR